MTARDSGDGPGKQGQKQADAQREACGRARLARDSIPIVSRLANAAQHAFGTLDARLGEYGGFVFGEKQRSARLRPDAICAVGAGFESRSVPRYTPKPRESPDVVVGFVVPRCRPFAGRAVGAIFAIPVRCIGCACVQKLLVFMTSRGDAPHIWSALLFSSAAGESGNQ